MHVIAIHRLGGDPDSLAARLAGVLGLTAYETRPRVAVPGGGPAVVARYADPAQAEARAAQLEQAGFAVLTADTANMCGPRLANEVRRLVLADAGLELQLADGQRQTVAGEDVDLLVSGTGIVQEWRTEVNRERTFSLGRALITGGLVLGKTRQTVSQEMAEERDRFCVLAGASLGRLILFQSRLDFAALGNQRQLTREANFSWLVGALRRHCPAAEWDDRLQTRAGQVQLLGAALPPEQHLDLAVDLLIRSYLTSRGEDSSATAGAGGDQAPAIGEDRS